MRIDDDTPEPGALPPIYPSRPPQNLVVEPELLRPRNLFAFEGIDGAGKSTLLDRVIAAHAARGRETLKLRLGRSDITAHALERAKWRNATPLTFSLLSWVTIVEQIAEHRDALDGDGLVFFDRYVPTLMVRGILEGLSTDYMHALAAYAPRPTILFLIDCDPAICRDRMIARGRPVSYFERGARIVGELHQPMTEGDPAIRGSADGAVPLLGHLVRMRDALGQRMADYDTVMVVDNEGSPDAAFETIMEAIDAVDRNRDASRIAAVSRAG